MPDLNAHRLYHKTFCPFCLKVRAALKMMKVKVALVNVGEDRTAYNELINKGGRGMVPCLRIQHDNGRVEWMYESDDIIRYFEKHFSK